MEVLFIVFRSLFAWAGHRLISRPSTKEHEAAAEQIVVPDETPLTAEEAVVGDNQSIDSQKTTELHSLAQETVTEKTSQQEQQVEATPDAHHSAELTPDAHHNAESTPDAHHNAESTPDAHHNAESTPDAQDAPSGAEVAKESHQQVHHDSGAHVAATEHTTSPEEIQNFLDMLSHMPESHVHDNNSGLAHEHMAAMALAPRGEATHVAIADGDWSDPDIWSRGEVPGAGAKVLIPPGISVSYGFESNVELHTVRIDGALSFETDVDSTMVFDTMLVSPSGYLEIGTAENPVSSNVQINLIVADNGPIDTEWDPLLLSRGLISHGKTSMHGAIKDSHEKVSEAPMAGDTSVTFKELPLEWQVGDTIVIAGTRYDGYKWDGSKVSHFESEDEERVISHIKGNTVHFDVALEHDHDTPRADLQTSVANYTRNISIESESGADSDDFARGHVMFMHSDDVDVRYVEFHELGRTDKSVESFDISSIENVAFDSNVQGRYSLHLHRSGVDDLNDPAMVIGNAVYGSPGWGFVHHDSNAHLENNASFDTHGAGYVAETGNETGAWVDNIAIYAEGNNWGPAKNNTILSNDQFDTARSGDGFWFQGRLVESTDNIAASVNHGFVYFHRDGDDRMINIPSNNFAYPDAIQDGGVTADDVPILGFQGNEAFAAKEGLHVVKANPNQGHDIWSHLDDFTAWSVIKGAHLEYTSHYILSDFDLIGKETTAFSHSQTGIDLDNNTSDIVIINSKIADFGSGITLKKNFLNDDWTEDQHGFFVVNPNINVRTTDYAEYNPEFDTILTDVSLETVVPKINLSGPLTYKEGYPDPAARIVEINGTKTDSLGETTYPSGTDDFTIYRTDIIRMLENDGYWTTSDGQKYMLVDLYTTDRLSAEIYYETHPIYLDENVPLGDAERAYSGAVYNGIQDIKTMADGTRMAGSTVLDTATLATPFDHLADFESSTTPPLNLTAEDLMHILTDRTQPVLDEHHVHEDPHMEHPGEITIDA